MLQNLRLLCRICSPWGEGLTPSDLADNKSTWETLCRISSTQWCSAFLHELLRNIADGDPALPVMAGSLRSACLENRLRNHLLQAELKALLQEFAATGIEVLLLKGAATFADQLYWSNGCRNMLDLDLLIRTNDIERAQSVLLNRGYKEIVDEGKTLTGLATDQRHAHINGYYKPGTPVQVELHYNIAYGQGGRILPAAKGWQHTLPASVDGAPAQILQPTWRLIHTTVHGLIPSCDYIKGKIRFWHIVEFAWLAKRYQQDIDWATWLKAADKEQQKTAFLAWLWLAHRLFAVEIPDTLTVGWWARLQGERLINGTLLHYHKEILVEHERLTWSERALFLLHQLYYWLNLPVWVWHNVCYAQGWKRIPMRVQVLLTKIFSRRSWQKV